MGVVLGNGDRDRADVKSRRHCYRMTHVKPALAVEICTFENA